jgi:hypothetical protein
MRQNRTVMGDAPRDSTGPPRQKGVKDTFDSVTESLTRLKTGQDG